MSIRMEKNDVSEEHGENVIIEETEAEPETETEAQPKVVDETPADDDLEKPKPTPTEKRKEYKRRMTEKRLEALRKAREAKANKRKQRIQQQRLPVSDKPQPKSQPKQNPIVREKQRTETEDERIERIVQERLKKYQPQEDPAVKARRERQDYFSKLMFG